MYIKGHLYIQTPLQMLNHSFHPIGTRNLSIFAILGSNLSQDLANDQGVQYYLTSLKRDPIVKFSSRLITNTNIIFLKSLSGLDRAVNFSLLPITYPLSRIMKKKEVKLKECPFKPQNPITITGKGYLVLRKNNYFDQFRLSLRNFGYRLELSPNPFLRNGYQCLKFVLLTPLTIHLLTYSKERSVLTAIDKYFPTFNGPDFCEWMKKSFLPVLLSAYISGHTSKMKCISDYGILQERQVQVSQEISRNHFIKSRLLSISNVGICDYDFKNGMPILSVKCDADLIQHIVNENGDDVDGNKENIKRAKMVVQMIINTDELPEWKAYEIRYASIDDRI